MRLLSIFLATVLAAGSTRAQIVYEKEIAPILRTYCAGCHNADEHENSFSVETYASFRKGGEDKGDPIKPGHADESFIVKSLESRAKPHMPPRDEPQVPPAELAILKQWIAQGASGPKNDVSILQTISVPKIAAQSRRTPITAAAWSPDGQQLAIAIAGKVELRASARGKAKKTLTGLPGKVNAVHFAAQGRQLVLAGGITGLSGVAQIYDINSGKLLHEFSGHRDTLYDAEISPDGKTLATAGYDRTIRLWNVSDQKLLRTIAVHNGAIFDLAFDPSGTVLASASADQTVKLWRVSDGVRLDTLNQPQGELNSVLFTPDGQHIIAAGADKRIHMWRFVSRENPMANPVEVSRFAHEAPITAIALTPDAKRLVTTAADRTLKIWTVPDLTEIDAYETQPDIVDVLAAVPREKKFLAARMDGSMQTYSLKPPKKSKTVAEAVAVSAPALSTNVTHLVEREPNNSPPTANRVLLPAEIKGAIESPGDADLFRFHAVAGQELTLAINAAQSKSRLDSRIEILTVDGKPIEQVVLQATRDSWFTFRGKDSETADDFRLQNWAEMELNEFLYANGEVVQLWLYPRGPDSGFKVYPGEGRRQTVFNTTAITHALNEPCYIVTAFPPGAQPAPNGLPIYRLNYENDDDPSRRAGADSLLLFTAPATADYIARVTDVRGFGGTNFNYTLNIREQRPDFSIAIEGANPQISPGSGREIRFVATRFEGFAGPIQIEIANLPTGFTASSPIQIEASQIAAIAGLYASADAKSPETNVASKIKIVARAKINGREITHEVKGLGDVKLGAPAKLLVEIIPGADHSHVKSAPGQPLELTIRPGETISAVVRATRRDFKDRIELGNEDSGRNLPHGVYIDNIGLNGLLIVEGQSERDFFITASKVAKPSTRTFHLRAKADGNQITAPAIIRVVAPSSDKVAAAGNSAR